VSIIGDEPCPQCRERGRDKTGNHLICYSDGGKHCNRCKYTVKPNGDTNKEDVPLPTGESAEAIHKYKPYEGDPIRGIPNKVRALYGDRVLIDVADGTPLKIYYPKGDGYKVRLLSEKKFYSIGKTKDVHELYGWDTVSYADTLILCGGEEDAKAAHTMLNAVMPRNMPRCVSLPNGEGAYAAISANLDKIRKHKKIVLCLDMDEVGQKANDKVAALIDKPCHVAELECKDPNDYLLLGAPTKNFVKAIVEAKRHSPGGIVHIADIMEDAMVKPEWGVPFPWPSLTAATYGMRGGEGYYIGAGVKLGKSEWLNELVKHLCTLEKKSFLIKGEEVVKKTARKLSGKLVSKIFHRPDIEVDLDEMRDALIELDRHIVLYDRNNSLDWDDVKAAIRHAVIVEGCKFVFIDPITCFTDGMEGSDADKFLKGFSRELDQMAKDLDFTYFCFCHLNNPSTGPEHNRGGKVLTSQFTGSRAMGRATTYMIGIERNKDPELDEDTQNTSYFVLLDDRENGNVARFPVFYDKDTGDYLEPKVEF